MCCSLETASRCMREWGRAVRAEGGKGGEPAEEPGACQVHDSPLKEGGELAGPAEPRLYIDGKRGGGQTGTEADAGLASPF